SFPGSPGRPARGLVPLLPAVWASFRRRQPSEGCRCCRYASIFPVSWESLLYIRPETSRISSNITNSLVFMISVEEATRIIQSNLYKPEVISAPLDQAVGAVLAGTITADRDFPPFDRASMDGIAVSAEAYASGRRSFTIEGTQPAGVPQKRLSNPAHCLEVMTGAVVPEGAGIVVRYEDVTIADGAATVNTADYIPAQNIHRKGADVREGDVLLLPGTFLGPSEIALLASVGKSQVKIRRLPRTAVVSTGDELVEIT